MCVSVHLYIHICFCACVRICVCVRVCVRTCCVREIMLLVRRKSVPAP